VRTLLCAALALAAALAAPAAVAQEGFLVRIDAVDVSGYPELRATVTALDASGRPMTDLSPEAFSAQSGGNSLPVLSVAAAADQGAGIAVVLAFDVSGSMEGAPLAQAKEAGKTLIGQLGPADSVAVIAFADAVEVVQPFTQDRAALAGAVDGLFISGNTALYEGVTRSVEAAASAALPRRAVVLLSDGQDYGTSSLVTREESLAAAGAGGVPLFIVGLGDLVDQQYLEDLAAAAQGHLAAAPAPAALLGLYQEIGAVLRHQYVLTLDAARLPGGAGSPLRVEVERGGAVAFAETTVNLREPAPEPVTVVATPNSAPVRPPVARPEPRETGAEGALDWAPLAAAAGVAAAAFAAALVIARRMRRLRIRRKIDAEFGGRDGFGPATAALGPPFVVDGRDARAWVWVVSPSGEESHPLGDAPVTIGFAPDCGIRLPDGAGKRWEKVRIWRREGRFMLHNLSRMGAVSVGGQPVTWAVLEDGDEIRMGPSVLTFREGA
jgi:Mg-chelatase subunit ChlD